MDEVAFGRYRLIALIGEGGMGKVYRAHDTVMGRDVAIKVLPPELATEPGYEERFRREAYTAARLTEPHIIPIHEAGEIDGRLYLVMPIIEGIDVHTLLQRDGPMSPQRAVQVIEQLAAALNAAHAAGLVHRDIKPSNALMAGDEFVYLIDFGIARDAAATRLTSTGMMVGTLAYMAPERFTAGIADARADVYALACVLYECLTGATPYPGNSMEQQIAGHLTLDPPRPSGRNRAIPAGFDEVIATGMAKKPDQRYQSARELAMAARRALTGVSAPARDAHAARTVVADPTQPAPAPVWQPPAYRDQPVARQRPPAPEPVAAPRQTRPVLIAAVVSIVVIIATAFIVFELLKPSSPASRTPTAQPGPSSEQTAQPASPPSAVSSAPAPSAGVAGLTPFVGVWQAHTERLVIDGTGTGRVTYRGADPQTENTLDLTLTSVANGVASGSVTASSDSRYSVGAPVTATLAAVVPGQLLQLSINGVQLLPFCNNAAEVGGQCGA